MAEASKFALAGVMGWPVSHSRSPVIHNHWLRQYRLPGAYVLLPVDPAKLAVAIPGLAALGFAGCNVTVPHKVAVMPLVQRVDPVATRIGAETAFALENSSRKIGVNSQRAGAFRRVSAQSLRAKIASFFGARGRSRRCDASRRGRCGRCDTGRRHDAARRGLVGTHGRNARLVGCASLSNDEAGPTLHVGLA